MNPQMAQSILVEVPAAEFAKKYRGMVMLLQEISKHGDTGISTSKLCYKVFKSRDSFCMKQLELAENWGYTTREVVHLEGRGHPYKINKITSRGKKLLQELRSNV
jgi:hypothetical protein